MERQGLEFSIFPTDFAGPGNEEMAGFYLRTNDKSLVEGRAESIASGHLRGTTVPRSQS
jgi:hypothetical protein